MNKNEKIFNELNKYQQSVLGAISYYGGYDIVDDCGLIDTLNSSYSSFSLDDLKQIKDIDTALKFYDEYVENDKDNGFENNDSINIDYDYELANYYTKSVNDCRDMLETALRTNTDIFDMIDKDFSVKGDEITDELGE